MMTYLEPPGTDPYFNLALEEHIFEHMPRDRAYFMLWQNDNAVVVGRYQNTMEEIDQAFVEAHGIRVVRRLSGGGAVFHDRGNLNFTFVVDQDPDGGFDFPLLTRPVLRALEAIGVQARFNGRNDLTIGGRKFSGNAQYARHGRLLHHGCIMLDSNVADVAGALKVKASKLADKGVASVRGRVTTVNANAPRPVSVEEFKALLKAQVAVEGGLKPYTLTKADLEGAERLRREKYATWAWNYGTSPTCHLRREGRTPAGLVTAFLEVSGGCIDRIRFFGDFFGGGDLRELEEAMTGLPLDSSLDGALEGLSVSRYMNGVTPAQLCRILLET